MSSEISVFKATLVFTLVCGAVLLLFRTTNKPSAKIVSSAPVSIKSIYNHSPSKTEAVSAAPSIESAKPALVQDPKTIPLRAQIAELEYRMEREEVIHRLNSGSLTPEIRQEYFTLIETLRAARTRLITMELDRIEKELDRSRNVRAAMVK